MVSTTSKLLRGLLSRILTRCKTQRPEIHNSEFEIIPVSTGDALAFPWRNVHKQSTSTDITAMNSTQAPMPSITTKFECLPLFEALSDVAFGS